MQTQQTYIKDNLTRWNGLTSNGTWYGLKLFVIHEFGANEAEQDEIEHREDGWVNRTVLQRLVAETGPSYPDPGFVAYDSDTPEGRAPLRAYLERLIALYRPLEEDWERQYPGVEFRRRVPGLEARLAELRTQFPGEF